MFQIYLKFQFDTRCICPYQFPVPEMFPVKPLGSVKNDHSDHSYDTMGPIINPVGSIIPNYSIYFFDIHWSNSFIFTPLIQYLRISTPILAGPLLASNFMGYNTRQSLYKWVVEYPEQ